MLKFVKQSVTTAINGAKVRLTEGDAWEGDDPLVKARPDLFSDRPERVLSSVEKVATARTVEEATAAPGTKRATKKTSARKGG